MALRCGKKRKLNSRDAYSQLKDADREKLEKSIDEKINEFAINADGDVFLDGESQTFASDEELLQSGFWQGKTGLFLTKDNESLPVFGPVGEIEKVWARTTCFEGKGGAGGDAGARIVLTKDNYGSRATGMGGKGFYMCEAIDIVAGSLSCEKTLKTGECRSRANFATDASRIYLTERGDIQNYFGLGEASKAVSISSDLKSGIGLKADHTLIIGRELVRIVAGLGHFEGGERLVNQQDYEKGVRPRIEIAAVGDSGAQPAVLGNALTQVLDQVKDEFINVYQKIWELEQKLIQYKYSLAFHVHSGAGIGAIQTFPDPAIVSEAMQSLAKPESGFLDVTRREVTDAMNQELKNYAWKGIQGEKEEGYVGNYLNPPKISALLSNTVHIGR
jgi:hypothetical protein